MTNLDSILKSRDITLPTKVHLVKATLSWKIPWTNETDRLQSMGSLRVRHDWVTSLSLLYIGEGNGSPLQCSCLRIPGTEEHGGLPSLGSHRVGHDWSDLAAAAAVKAMVFPVIMYGCESWTVKKAEHWRIDAFELWCWRKLLRVLGLQGDPTSPF